MEKFERFSEERLTSLRARYRGDDLFRTWTWILCLLEQQLNGLNAVEVWSETEMIRQKLSAIKEHLPGSPCRRIHTPPASHSPDSSYKVHAPESLQNRPLS